MKQLLRLKHWQLFMLLVGIPLVFQCVMTTAIVMGENIQIIFVALPIVMLISLAFFFSWFYTLGTALYSKLPPSASMSQTRFKIALFLPLSYISAIAAFVLTQVSHQPSGPSFNPSFLLLIIPLHLLSMAGIFYCLYFNAKALKTVELQRPVVFSEYVGELFLIWFFPIGIWIIQPRVNSIFRNETRKSVQPTTIW